MQNNLIKFSGRLGLCFRSERLSSFVPTASPPIVKNLGRHAAHRFYRASDESSGEPTDGGQTQRGNRFAVCIAPGLHYIVALRSG